MEMMDSCEDKLNNAPVQEFDYSYLEDEVRCGFYVPAVMKQFWAAEMETLKIFDSICSKHGFKYYADWGSLLGAVRHGGFIPWDDDLDVLMIREDYMALLKLQDEHPEEFPAGFEVRSFRNREDYLEFHGVVVGSDRISFEIDHLEKYHGFPYIAALDIFVLDHKSDDPDKQSEMAKNALYVIAVADEIGAGRLDRKSIESNLEKISKFRGVKDVPKDLSMTNTQLRIALYEVAEAMFASFSDEKSNKLIQNVPWGLLHPESEINAKDYENQIFLPFEFGTLPVPGAYDRMLNKKYGNYLKIVKGVGAHEYPCFAEQERALKANIDFKIPSFEFSKDKLEMMHKNRELSRQNSWKATAEECLENVRNLYNQIINDKGDVLQHLADMQQLVMDLGQFLESTGRVEEKNIAILEELCEAVFNFYNNVGEDELGNELRRCTENAFDITSRVLARREVVFIPFKEEGWSRLETFYNKEADDDNQDVVILDAPFYHKRYDGVIIDEIESKMDYSGAPNVFSYTEYDFEFYHPDKVYIQFPYDSWNPVMTIPSELYAERIASLTDELVYVPWFVTNDFTSKDVPDYVNTKYYIPMPGVVYADEIILPSDALREVYAEKLSEEYGDFPREEWENKMRVVGAETSSSRKNSTKKMFYYLGLSSFIQSDECILDKIERNIKVFGACSNNIDVVLYVDPAVELNLPQLKKDLWNAFRGIICNWQKEDNVSLVSNISPKEAAELCDAYYGDAGPFVVSFTESHKPVMIQNTEI